LIAWLVGEGAPDEKKGAAFSGVVGANDLLIVGPGVLGRLVAEKWREVLIFLYLIMLVTKC
jgi:hypothetical protein